MSCVPGRLVALRREYIAHDADGAVTGTIREAVTVKVGEDNITQHLTILDVETVAVFGDMPLEDDVVLTLQMARACGVRTVDGLRDTWTHRHPRSPRAQMVWFALGDVRDQPLFLQYSGLAGGDYTRNRHRALDEAEALTREQMAALVSVNLQRDLGRRAKASAALANETPSQRLTRINATIERLRQQLGDGIAHMAEKEIRQELRIVQQRLDRAERRPQ